MRRSFRRIFHEKIDFHRRVTPFVGCRTLIVFLGRFRAVSTVRVHFRGLVAVSGGITASVARARSPFFAVFLRFLEETGVSAVV